MKRKLLILLPTLLVVGAIAWFGLRMAQAVVAAKPAATLPVTRVKRGDVTIAVAARGELQGGNSEMLTAPMVGGSDLAITYLRSSGELVKEGDVVVEFDTTEQEFRLREAEADLAEAEQQVQQAEATAQAIDEESRYALLQAQTAVRLAELEVRRNPIMATIVARQNTLALEAAGDRLKQLQEDLSSRQANNKASIAIQDAARKKAKMAADTARRNIDSMTLKAHSTGYVNIQQNTGQNMIFWGMQLPIFQTGDGVRSGMAVAQIPDLKNWEVTANIGELDRGHLSQGQDVSISVIALSGKTFAGNVKEMGGTGGPPWDRRFECKINLKNPTPELRPGMSTRIRITTGMIPNALWLPSQALFESDGRAFVYARTPAGFMPQDVKLVRRSESQVVLTGLREGQVVALANPDQMNKKVDTGGGAMRALQK
jgi:multidrug efflux pump subunit AcrA (membrane-fusion protein)